MIQQFIALTTQSDLETTVKSLPNSNGKDAAAQLLPTALEVLFGVIGSVALLLIVINGFRYILSAGDPSKMSQAKKGIIYALIGLAITLAAFSIVALVAKGVA